MTKDGKIERTDLRVGNLVRYRGEIMFVCDIFGLIRLSDEEAVLDVECDELEPIALTDDLLAKCGFQKADKAFGYDNESRSLIYPFVEKDGSLYLLIGDSREIAVHMEYDDGYLLAECRYLHDLQNIYWTVSNRELAVEQILFG